MTITEWQKAIGEWGRSKGWDMSKIMSSDPEVKRDFVLHKLMLVVTEVSEAAECVRDDEYETKFESELADTVIRILHICEAMNIDLDHAIEVKMAINAQRAFMHGRKA